MKIRGPGDALRVVDGSDRQSPMVAKSGGSWSGMSAVCERRVEEGKRAVASPVVFEEMPVSLRLTAWVAWVSSRGGVAA